MSWAIVSFNRDGRMKYLLSLSVSLLLTFVALADADGPDYFRISGTISAQMFDDKSPQTKLVLLVPPGTDGIQNLGCEGAPSLADWQAMNEEARQAAKQSAWCKVSVNGRQGWIQNQFLSEGSTITTQPTFDCTAPRPHEIEILVCGDIALIALDNELAQVFQAAKTQASKLENSAQYAVKSLVAEQRGWIKDRNECWKDQQDKKACAMAVYQQRIADLKSKWGLQH